MKLRRLEEKDAPLMLEWMHDDSVVHNMGTDFSKKTIEDCLNFIEASIEDKENAHFAIVNDSDEYMGTVSLKHIHKEDGYAEFAITVRKSAMGKGYSKWGMLEILRYGFEIVGLDRIYWYVSPKNKRAVSFYDKNGYTQIMDVDDGIKANLNAAGIEYVWYMEKTGDDVLNSKK